MQDFVTVSTLESSAFEADLIYSFRVLESQSISTVAFGTGALIMEQFQRLIE